MNENYGINVLARNKQHIFVCKFKERKKKKQKEFYRYIFLLKKKKSEEM